MSFRPLCFAGGLVVGLAVGAAIAPAPRARKVAAIDWTNPDNAPPAFDDATGPHLYEQCERGPRCCVHCGGGKNHPIHSTLS